MEPRVAVFFYGSYINFEVLKEAGINARAFETGMINGFELTITPLANLAKTKQGIVYGILTELNHSELDRLYKEHALNKLGGKYLPEAVMVCHSNGTYAPALCYISSTMVKSNADVQYVDRILNPAKQYGFPQWYLDHIESFK